MLVDLLPNSIEFNSQFFREYILTPDGGQVSLDWYEPLPQRVESAASSSGCHLNESKPIALFLPGLTGDSQTEYVKSLVPAAYQLGYRSVVFNNRGRGNMKLLTPRLYCAANDDDLKLVLEHLRSNNPKTKIVATGISLGGIVLCRYLIRAGNDAVIDAAMLISVCWDFLSGNYQSISLSYRKIKSIETIFKSYSLERL